jgi:hypothetical protein
MEFEDETEFNHTERLPKYLKIDRWFNDKKIYWGRHIQKW